MSMRALEDLREMLCDELDEIAKKQEMSAGDLETIHKLTDTIKNIDKIIIMDEDGGYSQAGDWEMEGRGNYGRGSSYASSGKHYVSSSAETIASAAATAWAVIAEMGQKST